LVPRTVPVILMILGGLFLAAPVALAQADDQNCADFASQADAQAHLRADPRDPDGLDGNDDDGIACEGNPAPFDLTPVVAASGGGASGGVGADVLPRTGSGTTPALGVGAMLVTAGGALVWLARYRPRHAAS
jgi:LPXTG-motif cell wall-anchored protein